VSQRFGFVHLSARTPAGKTRPGRPPVGNSDTSGLSCASAGAVSLGEALTVHRPDMLQGINTIRWQSDSCQPARLGKCCPQEQNFTGEQHARSRRKARHPAPADPKGWNKLPRERGAVQSEVPCAQHRQAQTSLSGLTENRSRKGLGTEPPDWKTGGSRRIFQR
jgi:hypothetical protein